MAAERLRVCCLSVAGVEYNRLLQIPIPQPVDGELSSIDRIERRTQWNGTSVRALHPFDPGDCALLEAVNRGEFTIHGLRNRDLQRLLYSTPATDKQQTRK